MSGAENISGERRKLDFDVQRSIRYHTRRRQFFARMGSLIKVFTTIGGLGTVTTLLAKAGECWTLMYGTLAGVFSIIDLVIGTDRLATLHSDLCAQFIALQKEMILAGEEITQKKCSEFRARRLEIESQEPPVKHVLNAICHNELLRAQGYPNSHQVRISNLQKLFAPFFDWREDLIQEPSEN